METVGKNISSLSVYLREAHEVSPKLTPERIRELVFQYRLEKDLEFRDQVICSMLFWVFKIARDYARRYKAEHLLQDITQEGNIALFDAFRTFDPTLGYSFTTHSTSWIRMRIVRFLIDQAESIRLPAWKVQEGSVLRRTLASLEKKLGADPEEKKELEIQIADVKRSLADMNVFMISLDASSPFGDSERENDGAKYELIPGPDQVTQIMESLQELALTEKIMGYIRGRHDDRTARMCFYRFGMLTGEPETLEEVSNRYGITRERVRQIIDSVISDSRFVWFLVTELGLAFGGVPVFNGSHELTSKKGNASTITKVVRLIEREFRLKQGILSTKTTTPVVHQARQIAVWLAYYHTTNRLSDIAEYFGYSVGAISQLKNSCGKRREDDPGFMELVTKLEKDFLPPA